MIRRCDDRDFELIWTIINDGAQAYKGTIPADRWTEPYMSREKLQDEIDEGVEFWGYEEAGALVGVMGIQQVQDVTLVRHAYVGPFPNARLTCPWFWQTRSGGNSALKRDASLTRSSGQTFRSYR